MTTKTTSKAKATPKPSPFRGAGRTGGKLIAPQEAGRLLLDYYIAHMRTADGKPSTRQPGVITGKKMLEISEMQHQFFGQDRRIFDDYQKLTDNILSAHMGHEYYRQAVNFYLTAMNLDLMALLANYTVTRLENAYPVIMMPSQYEAWQKAGEKPPKPIAVIRPETMDPEQYKRMDEKQRFVMPTKFHITADINAHIANEPLIIRNLRFSYRHLAAYRKAFELIAEVRQAPRILDLMKYEPSKVLYESIPNYLVVLMGILPTDPGVSPDVFKAFQKVWDIEPIGPPTVAPKAIEAARTALEDPAYFTENTFEDLMRTLLGGVK